MKDYEQIERYLRGELCDKDIEALWLRFLQEPELYQYLETLLLLRAAGSTEGPELSPDRISW